LSPFALALLGGCALTSGERYEPLDVLRRVPIECEGAVGTERAELEERAVPDDEPLVAADRFAAAVHVGVVAAERVAAWTDGANGPLALVVARGAADEALRRHVELGRDGALAVASGRVAVIANERQVSFVERFDLKSLPAAAILDPVVGRYLVGSRVEVTPH